MRKSILLISATLMLAFLLAACGEQQETVAPGMEDTFETGDDFGLEPVLPGATIVPTDTMATKPAETEMVPTEVMTMEVSTDTVGATETVTSSEMIPVTAGKPDVGRISNLLDFEVRTSDGEQVGEVEDLVLNLDALRVQYVIVGVGGFLGIGEKEVAIPWGAFKLDIDDFRNDEIGDDNDNWLVLNINQEALENAPDWDPETMPQLGTPAADWDVDLRGYWHDFDVDVEINEDEIGEDEAVDTTEITGTVDTDLSLNGRLRGVILAKDPIGLPIQNDAGDTVAVLEDIVINLKSGKIIYVIVSVFDGADLDDVLIPVPPAAFRLDSSAPALVIADADVVLVDAPRFRIGEFPYTLDPDWDVDVRSYWQGLDIDVEINEDEIGEDNP
jgi:sporulation protein YlmC with PRC-barrel domain